MKECKAACDVQNNAFPEQEEVRFCLVLEHTRGHPDPKDNFVALRKTDTRGQTKGQTAQMRHKRVVRPTSCSELHNVIGFEPERSVYRLGAERRAEDPSTRLRTAALAPLPGAMAGGASLSLFKISTLHP